MKTIVVMRHAKSDWNNHLSDHQRPLNKRGINDAPKMAKEIIKMGIIPEIIFLSDSQRTKETWALMKNFLPKVKAEFTSELYLASSREIMHFISKVDNQFTRIMILAHNPGITDLFYELANVRIDNVPTAGVGCVQFNSDNFTDLQNNEGDLAYFTYPKKVY